MIDHLLVYLDVHGDGPLLVGEVYFALRGGRLAASTFHYTTSYLARRDAFPIDPDLPLDAGPHSVNGLPGALADCAPDRWGRNLITKQRRGEASASGGAARRLTEVDFLVGVSDLTRQGALRFRAADDGPFLGSGTEVPKLLELPRLLRAADAVSRDDDFAAIKQLLDAGTGSLGGARPKASVRDGDRLYIAKFPHPDDAWDVMAWEKTALDLARAAGIDVPPNELTRIDGRSVLLLERFDRRSGVRVPYQSAMTLLGARDGDVHDYLEIAEALAAVSAGAAADLSDLWRRIAFSIMVNNVDDHLRNHGLLHQRGGWRLSPVFDVNPNPDVATHRQTSVSGAYGRVEALDALRSCVADFDLAPRRAETILGEVAAAVATWRQVGASNGIITTEQRLFDDAFWPVN
ncbi:MAG: type II toxin-antitoxin system HipA family toxin [Acidimicrobiia bacterium]